MDKAEKTRRRPVLDDDELQIQKDIESGVYVARPDFEKQKLELQKAARKTMAKKPVTIRLMNMTVDQLKYIAQQQGLPYQTLVSSVLHKYVTGRLVERD